MQKQAFFGLFRTPWRANETTHYNVKKHVMNNNKTE